MLRQVVFSASKRVTCARWSPMAKMSSRSLATVQHYEKEHAHESLAARALFSAAVGVGSCFAVQVVACDNAEPVETDSDVVSQENNPLWPAGVSSEMVNGYVDEILDNPDINIQTIPDSIERLIYISTVRLTLNALYSSLSTFHGEEVLGHQLKLVKTGTGKKLNLHHSTRKINAKQLDDLASKLLGNKAVNQRWLPDRIERQLYTNCLKLVFSLLDTIADSLSICVCGHVLSLSFEPLLHDAIDQQLAAVDDDKPTRHLELNEAILEELVTETIRESQDTFDGTSLASYLPFYESFLRNLHKTLFSLILGIISDMLSKTELAVLEERIQMYLVPMEIETWRANRNTAENAVTKQQQEELIAQLKKELEEAHNAEAKARKIAGMGLMVGAVALTVAAFLQVVEN